MADVNEFKMHDAQNYISKVSVTHISVLVEAISSHNIAPSVVST